MAKIKLGALAGEVSGSIGAYTFSHNRGGPYIRLRNIPDKYTTTWALASKSRLAAVSGNWKNLASGIRDAWTSYASANPVVDSLGDKRPLTGSQAYVMLANRYWLMTNGLLLANPPGVEPPAALTALSITCAQAGPACQLTWTPTPIGASKCLYVSGCYVSSATKKFIKKDLRFIGCSPENQTSPYSWMPILETRLGTPITGQELVLSISVGDIATGLISLPLQARCTIS